MRTSSGPLECGHIVRRLVTKARDWDSATQQIGTSAFHLRPPTEDDEGDTDGLSVCTVEKSTLAEYEQVMPIKRIKAAFSLHPGRLRTLNLDVVADTEYHGLVKNIPYYDPDNSDFESIEQVEQLLSKIVDMTRYCPIPKS